MMALHPPTPTERTDLMHDTHAQAHTNSMAPTWTIHKVTPSSIQETSVFVNASRRELFPSLGHDPLLDDPQVLDKSCILVARDGSNKMVAAIAYVPFDYRFPQLPWPLGNSRSPSSQNDNSTSSSSTSSTANTTANSSSTSLSALPTAPTASSHPTISTTNPHSLVTVEVVRLFVLPSHRRCGLAASLFSALREHATASGVQCMYLHTHPFLPGAIQFWEKQGFRILCVDKEDQVWQTHHMQLMLRPS